MLLEFVCLYLPCELYSAYRFIRKLIRVRQESVPTEQRLPAQVWATEHRHQIPRLEYHQALEDRHQQFDILQPNYKPLPFYLLLRGAYYLATGIFLCLGYERCRYKGLIVWRKRGEGSQESTILFLHGFGFYIFPYLFVLQDLVRQGYTVVAPEFPLDAEELPTIEAYSRELLTLLPPQFSIISNSFGTFIHSCLLTLAHQRIQRQILVEPVCFYPYSANTMNFLKLDLHSICRSPWNRRTCLRLFSWLLVTRDFYVLRLCHRLRTELFWEGEQWLDEQTTIVFSGQDYIVASHLLSEYFQQNYPLVTLITMSELEHGEALFQLSTEKILAP